MEKRLSELIDSSSILVIASHSRELLLQLCNRVVWLKQGCVAADGNAREIIAQYFDQSIVAT
jgi:lipopolysaccharide transport system ATP-binding protein